MHFSNRKTRTRDPNAGFGLGAKTVRHKQSILGFMLSDPNRNMRRDPTEFGTISVFEKNSFFEISEEYMGSLASTGYRYSPNKNLVLICVDGDMKLGMCSVDPNTVVDASSLSGAEITNVNKGQFISIPPGTAYNISTVNGVYFIKIASPSYDKSCIILTDAAATKNPIDAYRAVREAPINEVSKLREWKAVGDRPSSDASYRERVASIIRHDRGYRRDHPQSRPHHNPMPLVAGKVHQEYTAPQTRSLGSSQFVDPRTDQVISGMNPSPIPMPQYSRASRDLIEQVRSIAPDEVE